MSQQLNISLDYDGTFTEEPAMFGQFFEWAKIYSHKVWVVTLRAERDTIPESALIERHCEGIIYCDGQSKRMVTEALGIHIDIWIDDQPECIANGSSLDSVQLAQWRKEQVK